MTDCTVTVLMTVRNGARYVVEALESIQKQTFADWEAIVVDDASEDRTTELVGSLGQADPRVRVIQRSSCGGPYVAANEGLRAARGRFIARLDADDVATPTRLAEQVSFLERSGLRACAGAWRTIGPDGRELEGPSRPPLDSSGGLQWSLCVAGGLVHSTLCIERSALECLGGYEELPTSGDLALWCAAARAGWLGVAPDVVVSWRQHPQQLGFVHREGQRGTSVSVLKEHLEALTGRDWDLGEVSALRGTARGEAVPLREGLCALDRWERSWRSDPTLREADQRKLRALARTARLRHIRNNHGADVIGIVSGLSGWWHARSSLSTTSR